MRVKKLFLHFLLNKYQILIEIPLKVGQLGYVLYQPTLNLKSCKINFMESMDTNQIYSGT